MFLMRGQKYIVGIQNKNVFNIRVVFFNQTRTLFYYLAWREVEGSEKQGLIVIDGNIKCAGVGTPGLVCSVGCSSSYIKIIGTVVAKNQRAVGQGKRKGDGIPALR